MTPERFARITQVLNRRQLSMSVITDGTHKSHNVAAIARTCDAFAIHQLQVVSPKDVKRHHRTSGGALGWLQVIRQDSTEEALDHARRQGHRIVAAHLSDQAIDYCQFDYTQPFSLVMGSELRGISATAAEQADAHLKIPMAGMVESFNVSVACALILGEAFRQRSAKGWQHYQRELPAADYEYWLFRWLYPKLAVYCDDRGLDYPPINAQGDLVEPAKWYQEVRELHE